MISHGGGIDRLFVGLAWIESLLRRIGWEGLISGVWRSIGCIEETGEGEQYSGSRLARDKGLCSFGRSSLQIVSFFLAARQDGTTCKLYF